MFLALHGDVTRPLGKESGKARLTCLDVFPVCFCFLDFVVVSGCWLKVYTYNRFSTAGATVTSHDTLNQSPEKRGSD